MVRAILEGRKTVTRRICKDGNDFVVPDMSFYDADKRTYAVHNYANADHTEKLSLVERTCPICPGDILYVRETYCPDYFDFITQYGSRHGYKAEYDRAVSSSDIPKPKWTPSIHMPKEAARIFLKVTDVRVERLHDITEEQAIKEGFEGVRCSCNGTAYACTDCYNTGWAEPPYVGFMNTWDSTIKKQGLAMYGWEANPWVWVLEFERIYPDNKKWGKSKSDD